MRISKQLSSMAAIADPGSGGISCNLSGKAAYLALGGGEGTGLGLLGEGLHSNSIQAALSTALQAAQKQHAETANTASRQRVLLVGCCLDYCQDHTTPLCW